MAQITYADKTALYQNADVAAENKVRDIDMNEIKQVVNDNETKILLDVTDTAPAECSTGDMYFDTTDNLIYTATATDTWSSTGVAPTENTIYVVIDTQTSYIYDGITLVSVGGGSGGIVVAPDIPTEDTQLYIESTDLDGQYLPVEEDIYSTTEVKTDKIWIDGKPIYRKVINFGALPNNDIKQVAHNINNIDTIITIRGTSTNGTNNLPLPSSSQDSVAQNINLGVTSTMVTIAATTDRSAYTKTYVILEYTKN